MRRLLKGKGDQSSCMRAVLAIPIFLTLHGKVVSILAALATLWHDRNSRQITSNFTTLLLYNYNLKTNPEGYR
jgi:hypothetical protein